MKKNESNLIYMIKNKKYLLIEPVYTSNYELKKDAERLINMGAILQGFKELRMGLFGGSVCARFLIPLNKIDEWVSMTKEDL